MSEEIPSTEDRLNNLLSLSANLRWAATTFREAAIESLEVLQQIAEKKIECSQSPQFQSAVYRIHSALHATRSLFPTERQK